jgi:hypothetical protein
MSKERDREREALKQELASLRDEIRVQVHLATMEAREAWQTLEKTVDQAEQELTRLGAQALAATRDVLVRARKEVQRRREQARTTPLA